MNPVNHPTQWTATEVLGRLAILIDPLRRRTERERRPRTYGRAILHPSQHSHGRSAAAQRRATQVGPSDEEGLRRVALYPDGWSSASPGGTLRRRRHDCSALSARRWVAMGRRTSARNSRGGACRNDRLRANPVDTQVSRANSPWTIPFTAGIWEIPDE